MLYLCLVRLYINNESSCNTPEIQIVDKNKNGIFDNGEEKGSYGESAIRMVPII